MGIVYYDLLRNCVVSEASGKKKKKYINKKKKKKKNREWASLEGGSEGKTCHFAPEPRGALI